MRRAGRERPAGGSRYRPPFADTWIMPLPRILGFGRPAAFDPGSRIPTTQPLPTLPPSTSSARPRLGPCSHQSFLSSTPCSAPALARHGRNRARAKIIRDAPSRDGFLCMFADARRRASQAVRDAGNVDDSDAWRSPGGLSRLGTSCGSTVLETERSWPGVYNNVRLARR